MGFYSDWIDKTTLDDPVNFPYEPQGNNFPEQNKNVISEWSCPSWADDDTFTPSVESTLSNGVNPDTGEWNLTATNLTLAQRNKLEEFFRTSPPNDRFVFYKARLNSIAPNGFLVEITKFKGEKNKNFPWYDCQFTLKNKGVIT